MILGFDQLNDQDLIDGNNETMLDTTPTEEEEINFMFLQGNEDPLNFNLDFQQQEQRQIQPQQQQQGLFENIQQQTQQQRLQQQQQQQQQREKQGGFLETMMRSSEMNQKTSQQQQIQQMQQMQQQSTFQTRMNQRLSPGPTSITQDENIYIEQLIQHEKLDHYEPPRKKMRKKKEDPDYMMMDRSSESPPNLDFLTNPPKQPFLHLKKQQQEQKAMTLKKRKKTPTKKNNSNKKKSHKRSQAEIQKDKERLAYLVALKNPTEEEKDERKRLRNRETAKLSRDKKKREVRELQHQLCDMETENTRLEKKLAEANHEIRVLRGIIQDCPTCHAKAETSFPKKTLFLFCIIFCIGITGLFMMAPTLKSTASKELVATQGNMYQGHHRNLLNANDIHTKINIQQEQQQQHQTQKQTIQYAQATREKQEHGGEGSGLLVDNQYDTRFMPHSLITEGLERDRILVPGIVKGHFATPAATQHTDVNNTSPLEPSITNNPSKSQALTNKSRSNTKKLTTDLEEAVLYHHAINHNGVDEDDENNENTGESEALLFCPFVYPLLPAPDSKRTTFDNHQSIKILYPLEVIENNDTKLYRLGQLQTVPVSSDSPQSDIYLKFEEYEKLTKQSAITVLNQKSPENI